MAEATSPIDPSQTLGFLLAAFLRSRKLKGRRQGTIDAYTLAARELHDYLLKELDADNIQLADRRVIEDFLVKAEPFHRLASTIARKISYPCGGTTAFPRHLRRGRLFVFSVVTRGGSHSCCC